MTSEFAVQTAIAVLGLVLAAVQLITGFGRRTAKVFADQALDLLELRKKLELAGGPAGRGSRREANVAHSDLLDRLEVEARVSAASYLIRAERSHGSSGWGLLWTVYGALFTLSFFVPTGESLVEQTISSSAPGVAKVIILSIVSVPLIATAFGFGLLRRRHDARRSRLAAGVKDPMTVEALIDDLATFANAVGRGIRRRARVR